jgi:glutamate-1-semialdehyde 2,1-aminomutase
MALAAEETREGDVTMASSAGGAGRAARSWEAFRESKRCLGGGSSTNSKTPAFEGVEPAQIVRGKGCRVWDLDGNEYIDFRNGLGPISLGYAVPEVDAAITEQLGRGIIFGHPHPLEGEVARLLTEVIPCAERARFLKTGGEAVAACVKIARNATGRSKIAHCGYNGWLSSLSRPRGATPRGIASADVARGVPAAIGALHVSLPWADLGPWEEWMRAEGKDTAAFVVACDYAGIEKGKEFLPALRELATRHGALLVMDEIVTGFRLAMAGAQEYFGVKPDLAVFAKGFANGMPLSAYVGRADLIDSAPGLGISSTFGGEALSLAAAKAVITFYRTRGVIEHLWRVGSWLWPRVQERARAAGSSLQVRGAPVCPSLEFASPAEKDRFMAGCYRNGVSLYDVSYVNYSHKDADVAEALERMGRAL